MALADALHSLLRLPGATYSCVVERDSGRVLAEVGQGEAASGDSEGVVPYSVPRWGTAVAAMFDSTSGDELDDVMITGRRSYHLVRPIGPGASVLVYLRLDRSRSNLAAARRELATLRLAGGAAPDVATVPAARSGSDAAAPAAARSRSDASGRAARSRSDAVARSRTDATAPAARSRGVAVTPPAPPAGVPAALAPPSTPARGARRTGSAAASGAARAGSPRSSTDTDASRAAASPAARSSGSRSSDTRSSASRSSGSRSSGSRSSGSRSSGSRSSGSPSSGDTPAVRTRSGTTRQIPLPRRASTRSASDAGPVRPRSEAGPVGAVDAPGEPAPEGFAMPAVVGQSWARDPGTLRRLIAGLRRMT